MKIQERCCTCLQHFARQIALLSGADEDLVKLSFDLIEELYSPMKAPIDISNPLLKYIREATGVADPFAAKKEAEFTQSKGAAAAYQYLFTADLEGLLRYSCLGNSHDYFGGAYNTDSFHFSGDVESIREVIANAGGSALFFGDNVGDFFFDLPLAHFLEGAGRVVYYAVKEAPAQNDLSLADVDRWGLRNIFPRIISTGSDEVGMRKECMSDMVRDLWESDALVIAKGMANYESIS